jgi:hypothetical protein
MNLPEYFPKSFKKVNDKWHAGNQISTYELCGHIKRELNKNDNWMNNLYNTLKDDSVNKVFTYGTYAGLNNWSPTFTDKQLEEFISLVKNTKVKKPS